MLNMKFAETMELTEAELMEVRGGTQTLPYIRRIDGGGWGVPGIYPGWGGRGMSPHTGPFDWSIDIGIGLAQRRNQ